MYTIHKTTYNITTTKEITNTNFYLLGKDFVDEYTYKYDMEILFKKLRRLTKVAPLFILYMAIIKARQNSQEINSITKSQKTTLPF